MVNLSGKIKKMKPMPISKLNVVLGQAKTIQLTEGQSGKVKSEPRDRARRSLPPGKRISKNGNIYWETRKNRSDYRGRI